MVAGCELNLSGDAPHFSLPLNLHRPKEKEDQALTPGPSESGSLESSVPNDSVRN